MTATPIPETDLDAFLEGEEPEWDTEPEAPPDATNADRMLRRLAGVRRARAADEAVAKARILDVEAWLERRVEVAASQERWLLEALERYHQAVLSLDPKRKTIHLPTGDLAARDGSWQWDVDEAEVMTWLLQEEGTQAVFDAVGAYLEGVARVREVLGDRAELLRMKAPPAVEVALANLQKWAVIRDERGKPLERGVTPDGERVPGVTVRRGERTYTVKLRGDDPEEAPEEEPPPFEVVPETTNETEDDR